MGKPTGFLEYARESDIVCDPQQRIEHFNDFHVSLPLAQRRAQSARCMNCGVPFCGSAIELSGMVTGCPLHNLIPEWNDEIFQGNDRQGLYRLLKTNPFPEFTGRVCPALCEKACICGLDGEAVAIRDNERYLIEEGYRTGAMVPQIPAVRSGKTVAVIGAGPAGLAVAHKLNQRGHTVTVFERDDQMGGLLMYGIPNMKLEKDVVLRRVQLMEAEGITFVPNADFGRTLWPKRVVSEFDAVVLCCGAKAARDLTVDYQGIRGVSFAVDFLASTTKSLMHYNMAEGTYQSARDKHVVIVGGGDTGNDCVGTAIRHGAKSVVQLEMMPQAPLVRQPSNPWPEWPRVCNTDYGQEEAIASFGQDPRIYQTTVKEICHQNGHMTDIITVKVTFQDGKLQEVPNSEMKLPCDLLLIAAGFVGPETYTTLDLGIVLPQRRGTSYGTNLENVFACGDMKRGQSLVVWAISEGVQCAQEVDNYLLKL